MSQTGDVVYFKKFHTGNAEEILSFPSDVQGVGMMLCGHQNGTPPPDELAIDHLLASVAIYRFETLMFAMGWDEATCKDMILKVEKYLADLLQKQLDAANAKIEQPKLIVVP